MPNAKDSLRSFPGVIGRFRGMRENLIPIATDVERNAASNEDGFADWEPQMREETPATPSTPHDAEQDTARGRLRQIVGPGAG